MAARSTRTGVHDQTSHPAVDDDQSKSADAVDDASGPFVHACYCGRWGFFGYEVALLNDRTGTWFCAEEWDSAAAIWLLVQLIISSLWFGSVQQQS